MSQYYGAIETTRGIKLRSVEVFKHDLEVLEEMFPGITNNWDIDYHEKEPYVFFNGDENCSLDFETDEFGEWAERLPPEDWSDEQKAAHAAAFGYLDYYREFSEPEESSDVRLLAFLQHHMVEGEVAVMHGVSHERYSTWSWMVAFTHDRQEWMGADDVRKHLEAKIKEPKSS